jgi:hypothetical protein
MLSSVTTDDVEEERVMIKQFVSTAAAIAVLGLGSAAMAQSAMQGDAMHGDAMKPASTAMVCRASSKDEKPNAMMGQEGLMCKSVDMAKAKATFSQTMMAKGGVTQADIDAAWQKAFGDQNLLGVFQ